MIHVPRSFLANPIHTQLEQGRRYCCFIYERRFPSLIITSPEGIGKTYLVEQVALSFGKAFNPQHPGTVLGLVRVLIDQTDILVLDDCDRFWFDREGLNVLKSALDTRDRRIISHTTGTKSIPPTQIKCGVIQISNLDFSDPSKFPKDIKPVLDRSLRIGLTFNSLDL